MHMPAFIVSLALAAILPGQAVLTVGPAGYPDFPDAIAAANPGDIIEIHAGTYTNASIDEGLTIRGFGEVTLSNSGLAEPPTWDVPVGQELHVADLRLSSVRITGGRVTFDTCVINGGGASPALAIEQAAVHTQRCSIVGTSVLATINVQSGILTAATSSIWASPIPAPSPTAAIYANDSRVQITASQLRFSTSHGVIAENATTAWFCDTELVSLSSSPNCAFDSTASTLRTDRLTLLGTSLTSCGSTQADTLLAVDRPDPLQAGNPFTLAFATAPNDLVAVFAAPLLDTVEFAPVIEQPSWLDGPTSFLAGVALADGDGLASVTWQIPAGPGIANQRLWFKGISGFALPLQTSPPVGGIVR